MLIKGHRYKFEEALTELKKRALNKLVSKRLCECWNAVTWKTLGESGCLEWVVMYMATTNLCLSHLCLIGNTNLA